MDNRNMIADYMEDETFAFGQDTGLFQAFLDEKSIDGNNNFSDVDIPSKCSGLFPEFGIQDEDVPTGWSLLEELELTSVQEPHGKDIFGNVPSPRSPILNEASFREEYCLLSPLSDSGDSGISSCHSPYNADFSPYGENSTPYSNGVNSSVGIADKPGSGFENVPFSESNEDLLAELVSDLTKAPDDTGDGHFLPDLDISDQNDQMDSVVAGSGIDRVVLEESQPITECEVTSNENLETDEVPFIEENNISPDIVHELETSCEAVIEQKPIKIKPAPAEMTVASQKVYIVKAQINRSSPYPKKKPNGKRSVEQKAKKKDQNRSAATRYRNKKKDELQGLFNEAAELEDVNRGLKDKVTSLTKEIDYLKSLMLDVIKAKLGRANSSD